MVYVIAMFVSLYVGIVIAKWAIKARNTIINKSLITGGFLYFLHSKKFINLLKSLL